MPRQMWLLQRDVPVIEVQLREPFTGFWVNRVLLADTGAGPCFSPFEIVLSPADIARCGEEELAEAGVSGALQGRLVIHKVRLQISALNVQSSVRALCAPASSLLMGLDGIGAFRFLNGFSYGNFGTPDQFGLEVLGSGGIASKSVTPQSRPSSSIAEVICPR